MNAPIMLFIICAIVFIGWFCLYKVYRSGRIWEVQRRIKKARIRNEITYIEETYRRASGNGKKINLIEKGKVKKRFDKSKTAYEEYIQFCETKSLTITSEEQNLISTISETEDLLYPEKALDKALERASIEYDEVYRQANESGEELLSRKLEAIETIDQIEVFINSIAKCPKEFDSDIQEIHIQKTQFQNALTFGQEQQKALKASLGSAGAGIGAGVAVASMAPTAAMWVATTFGTASTGTAISALSGAAASNAALAWLGGGAIAAGGSGMAAGQALLALAGPVGWGIAGTSLLISILLLWRKRMKIQENKKDEVARMQNCTTALKALKADMDNLAIQIAQLHTCLSDYFMSCRALQNGDYSSFSQDQKNQLGAIVNNAKALSVLLSKVLAPEENNDIRKKKRTAHKKQSGTSNGLLD